MQQSLQAGAPAAALPALLHGVRALPSLYCNNPACCPRSGTRSTPPWPPRSAPSSRQRRRGAQSRLSRPPSARSSARRRCRQKRGARAAVAAASEWGIRSTGVRATCTWLLYGIRCITSWRFLHPRTDERCCIPSCLVKVRLLTTASFYLMQGQEGQEGGCACRRPSCNSLPGNRQRC